MVIYTYQANESVSVNGFVVRDEVLIANQDSGVLDLTRSEGAKVSAKGEVARVYSSQDSLDNQGEITRLETLVAQLTYAISAVENAANSLTLDQEIFQTILDYRQDVETGEIEDATAQGAQLRNLVVTQGFIQEDVETLSDWLSTAQSDLTTANRNTASASKIITSSQSGIYSAVVDGYEALLTIDTSDQWLPSTLATMVPDEGVYSNVGKLILGDVWQYVVTVDALVAQQAEVEGTVDLKFSKSFDKTLTMNVASVSEQEDGQCVLVLESDRYLGDLTLLREQSATLIFDTLDGFRVPATALRVDENGQTGVYCLVGIRARFKPVSVVYEGSDFLLVESATTVSSDQLQDGEQVIIGAKDLYDGKVIE